MINRVLIRIKVLQIVYAYYLKENDMKSAENELLQSLRKSYDLYHYLLMLIVEVTRYHERQIDSRRNKYMPTEEDLNPDMRLVNNRLAHVISINEHLKAYDKQYHVSPFEDTEIIKTVLETILKSDIYEEYLNAPEDNFETDREFWRKVFKKLITNNEVIDELLEEKCIYWNEEIEIVESFVIKTIKHLKDSPDALNLLIPMFNNESDREYVFKLFKQTILNGDDYRKRVNSHACNWEAERVAPMDMIIMQLAITEIIHFPTIPISVSLNEYIDAAKYYSTPKSGVFINGVLESIIAELRKENILLK
ncbi:MAG: transcription antitermination protein NusB [Tannerella sp.]|jgi:N utilization substance protein B|nr:transcription antitermination protein NusB [Tannerella sp.]